MERLLRFEALLRDWQGRLNLVAPSTLSDLWSRHFADSAQLSGVVEPGRHWLDAGSGAGFPGLVLAAMDWGRITLVESIAKKCRFLEAVAEALRLANAEIVQARVEALAPARAEVVTARAVAPLARLFDWTVRHGRPETRWVFPKGRRWADEVAAARKTFAFELETHQSLTEPEARILVARNLRRRCNP
ncbi:16S rRNA (guanine(527)-N(7))-methyltransferase RsmG [Thermaurantiacus sp.]